MEGEEVKEGGGERGRGGEEMKEGEEGVIIPKPPVQRMRITTDEEPYKRLRLSGGVVFRQQFNLTAGLCRAKRSSCKTENQHVLMYDTAK